MNKGEEDAIKLDMFLRVSVSSVEPEVEETNKVEDPSINQPVEVKVMWFSDWWQNWQHHTDAKFCFIFLAYSSEAHFFFKLLSILWTTNLGWRCYYCVSICFLSARSLCNCWANLKSSWLNIIRSTAARRVSCWWIFKSQSHKNVSVFSV